MNRVRVRVPELVALRALIAIAVLAWPVTASVHGVVVLEEIPAARVALTLTVVLLLLLGSAYVARPAGIDLVPARRGRHKREATDR